MFAAYLLSPLALLSGRARLDHIHQILSNHLRPADRIDFLNCSSCTRAMSVPSAL